MQVEASHYRKLTKGRVQCLLCPHSCQLAPDETGKCGVRRNEAGSLRTYTYGSISGIATDPIEKKPLYHFLPGTGILSIGSFGCTMTCLHCQNDHISQCNYESARRRSGTSPEDVIRFAKESNVPSIAYTYNEPVVYYEFMRKIAETATQQGLLNVMVTNGFIQPEPLRELLPWIDALNVDLKAFNDRFYREVCGANLVHVLKALDIMQKHGSYFELTFLVIEGLNDNREEFKKMTDHIATRFGADCVLHISRYFPRYKLSTPTTREETIGELIEMARERLNYVYAGNMGTRNFSDTYCPSCSALLIERVNYNTAVRGISYGKCVKCGHMIHGKFT